MAEDSREEFTNRSNSIKMATGESTGPEERQGYPSPSADGGGVVDSNLNSADEDQSASQVLMEPSPSADHQVPPPPLPEVVVVAAAGEKGRVVQNVLPSKVVSTSTTANIPQLLPNAVIAIVQPTTRITSNYQRIPGNTTVTTTTTAKHRGGQGLMPTGQGGGGGNGSHYVAQRVVVTAPGGGHSHGSSKQQQSHHHHQHSVPVQASQASSQQRVLSQVSYAPGIAIHHCQPPPPTGAGTVVSGTAATNSVAPVWPIVDPVFHFGPGFEPPSRPYCPAHEPQPQEHVVMFHVHPGVSVSFQVNGNQEIVRGKWFSV